MRLIVHIGMPKTATTTLQNVLARNRQSLAERGVFYPKLSHLSHAHHMLMPLFKEPKDAWGRVKAKYGSARKMTEAAEADWAALRETISATRPDTVILSTESLFVTLSEPYLAAFCARLRTISSDIQIVAYVREPASYYASILTHRARRTVIPRPADPIEYAAPLRQFERVLGNKPTVRVFARDLLENGDIAEDFFKHVIGSAVEKPSGKLERNVSLSSEVAEIFQKYKAISTGRGNWSRTPDDSVTIRKLCAVERSISKRGPLKLKEVVVKAMTAPTEDLKWLRDEHSITFSTVNYDSSGPNPGSQPPKVGRLRDALIFDDEIQSRIFERLEHKMPEVYAAVRTVT